MKTSHPSHPLKTSQLPSLTGLRGLAAMTVFAQHASSVWNGGDENATLLRIAFSAASFFFLLSGFLFSWSWRPDRSTRGFWRGRATKILPLHLVTLVFGVLLAVAAGPLPPVRAWLPNALLVQTWSPGFDILDPGINGVSWSLCCEALFYLLFPLLARPVHRIAPRLLPACAGACVAAVALIPLLVVTVRPAVAGQATFGPFPDTTHQMWLVYSFPPARLPEFVLGMLLARMAREGLGRGVRGWHGAAAYAALYPLAIAVPLVWSAVAVMVVPLALVLLGAVAADLRGDRSPLRHPVAVRLGELSFGLYMCHLLVLEHGCRVLDCARTASTAVRAADTVVLLAVSLGLAWLLHTCVERPLLRGPHGTAPPRDGGKKPTPPTSGVPVTGEPVTGAPAATQPAVAQPAVAQPAAGQPAVAQPAVAQPAVAQPAVEEPPPAPVQRTGTDTMPQGRIGR
ncbi:acyltransferase family protein [Streptomyces corynorhini]|uniref:acyltransferase family protein n=1 Tax=Streptomyces corynorhini TaxID=2282652 RepID=UPI0018F2818F|nr:acyltransferase [Streptomyces corynorhini]